MSRVTPCMLTVAPCERSHAQNCLRTMDIWPDTQTTIEPKGFPGGGGGNGAGGNGAGGNGAGGTGAGAGGARTRGGGGAGSDDGAAAAPDAWLYGHLSPSLQYPLAKCLQSVAARGFFAGGIAAAAGACFCPVSCWRRTERTVPDIVFFCCMPCKSIM